MTETLILPVGESLGPIVGDDGSVKYRLHSGLEQVELDEDTHGMWRAAHSVPGDKTVFWGPDQALQLAHKNKVRDPETGLDKLVRQGLVQILPITLEDVGRFIYQHRIEARAEVLGLSADLEGFWVIGLGEVVLALVTPDAANMFVYGPLFETIWEVARAVVSVSPTQVPAEVAHISKDRMIVEKFLMEAPVLLSVGAMHFKRAQRPVGEER